MPAPHRPNLAAELAEISDILGAIATNLARSSWTHNQAIDIHIAAKRLTTIAAQLAQRPAASTRPAAPIAA